MGDIADFIADEIVDMTADPPMLYEGLSAEPLVSWGGDGVKQTKTCRYCGKKGLIWGLSGDKWRLFEFIRNDDGWKNEVHECKEYK